MPALVSATPREVPVPSPALTSDAQTPRTLTVASWTENPAALVLPWGLGCDRRGLSLPAFVSLKTFAALSRLETHPTLSKPLLN